MAGFLARLLGRVETRDAVGTMRAFPGAYPVQTDATGRTLSPMAAENLAAVLASIGAISSAVASLAPLTFRREGTDRTELPQGHWLARLMRSPSEQFSYPEWCEQVIADCLLHGNALCEIVSDAGGRVTALEPIGWRRVAVSLLPSGRVVYDITPPSTAWGGSPRMRRLLDDEVLHLRDRTNAGEVVARSRLARAGGAMANVAALQSMSLAVWENGMKPDGYFSFPGTLTSQQRDLLNDLLGRFRSASRGGKQLLLEAGVKFEQLGIDAESAQTLESRRFGITEVARIFQIPPPLIQDYTHNTFTNSEQASRWFGQFTIAPWARKLEAALQRCVIGPQSDLSIECDLSTLLRGSDLERWQTYKIALDAGVLDPGEVRIAEAWGPWPAGRVPRPAEAPPVA